MSAGIDETCSSSGVSMKASNDAHCPQHILEFLDQKFAWKVESIVAVPSAQQYVWILHVQPNTDEQEDSRTNAESISNGWRDMCHSALQMGTSQVVVRVWRGSARWWNLNSSKDEPASLLELARSEVAGYRMAHDILTINTIRPITMLHQPQVLYFSHDNPHDDVSHPYLTPWAIFSYVGATSQHYITPSKNGTHWRCDNGAFAAAMIKARYEFGYNEPHPRHGRVCTKYSLTYGKKLLRTILFPIHHWFFQLHGLRNKTHTDGRQSEHRNEQLLHALGTHPTMDPPKEGGARPRRYMDMIHLYEVALQRIAQISHGNIIGSKLDKVIQLLGPCLERLKLEAKDNGLEEEEEKKQNIPGVLCHLDLQPQNLIFKRALDSVDDDTIPEVASVLDWEEAAFCDPRFELLLICRKVLANHAQATELWSMYQTNLQDGFGLDIGSLEPWLQLETVHSIFTLTLQALDLGGRSPWESKPDVWHKVQRELSRLVYRGWSFCLLPEMEDLI
jgi:hypothetical protein